MQGIIILLVKYLQKYVHLTTIPAEPGFRWEFVLLYLKTCSLYHEKLFIQKFDDIITQPLTSWRLSEAVSASIGMNARLRDSSNVRDLLAQQ